MLARGRGVGSLEFAGWQGVVKRPGLSRHCGCAEQVAPSSSCFSPRTRLHLEPFRDISSPTTPTIHFCQDTLTVHCYHKTHLSARQDISAPPPSPYLYNWRHRAHMRLCSILVSKNKCAFPTTNNTGQPDSLAVRGKHAQRGGLRRRPEFRSVTVPASLN